MPGRSFACRLVQVFRPSPLPCTSVMLLGNPTRRGHGAHPGTSASRMAPVLACVNVCAGPVRRGDEHRHRDASSTSRKGPPMDRMVQSPATRQNTGITHDLQGQRETTPGWPTALVRSLCGVCERWPGTSEEDCRGRRTRDHRDAPSRRRARRPGLETGQISFNWRTSGSTVAFVGSGHSMAQVIPIQRLPGMPTSDTSPAPK